MRLPPSREVWWSTVRGPPQIPDKENSLRTEECNKMLLPRKGQAELSCGTMHGCPPSRPTTSPCWPVGKGLFLWDDAIPQRGSSPRISQNTNFFFLLREENLDARKATLHKSPLTHDQLRVAGRLWKSNEFGLGCTQFWRFSDVVGSSFSRSSWCVFLL